MTIKKQTMKSRALFIALIAIVSCNNTWAQDSNYKANVGNNPIVFTTPDTSYFEVGYDKRELLEIFVPTQNRLICAFIRKADVGVLDPTRTESMNFDSYMLVEVLRQAEYIDLLPDDFKGLVSEIKTSMTDNLSEITDNTNAQMAERESVIGKMEIGATEILGYFLDIDNAYGIIMAANVSAAGITKRIVCGTSFLRLNNRMIYMYVYATYKDDSSVQWVKDISTKWIKEILATNKN